MCDSKAHRVLLTSLRSCSGNARFSVRSLVYT